MVAPRHRSGGATLRLSAGLLAIGILAGCGRSGAAGHGSPNVQAAKGNATGQQASLAAHARAEVEPVAQALARSLRVAGLLPSSAVRGNYVLCRPRSALKA